MRLGCSEQELKLKMAGETGLEPAAFCVTGRRYNQLNYSPNNRMSKNDHVKNSGYFRQEENHQLFVFLKDSLQ
jgi:hypothetical protein